MPRILVIDDDPVIGHLLFSHFEEMGYVTHRATTGMDALGLAAVEMYDVVFLDVRLPDGSGLDIIGDLKESAGKPEVIIITGYGEPDGAALAINSGAWDYIEKPFKLKQVTLLLMRVLEHRERRARQGPQSSLKRDGLIGSSPKINSCLNQVFEASQVDASVLIVGETGTGKELFARAIHNNSRRSNASFMAVDCASLPETLAESVLFGHEKGAFTGAHTRRDGMFAQADGGTLFLDEIGELRPMMQAKLLRVLQERVYRPVGSARDLRSDFRLVAATNRDLDSMTESGHFRKDLLFRLRSFTLKLPPLRERPEDIKEICTYHAARLAKHYSIPEKSFSKDFFETVESYEWPGNVRELVGALEYAIGAAFNDSAICPHHLPKDLRAKIAANNVSGHVSPGLLVDSVEENGFFSDMPNFKQWRSEKISLIEREYLMGLIATCRGDLSKALDVSGLSKSRLYDLLGKHELKLHQPAKSGFFGLPVFSDNI